ncbi:MAG: hypothetical protein ACRDRO_14705 [Pseudonocardiaceae bacterium]
MATAINQLEEQIEGVAASVSVLKPIADGGANYRDFVSKSFPTGLR